MKINIISNKSKNIFIYILIAISIILPIVILLFSPISSKIGSWSEVARWEAPNRYQFDRENIYLSIENFHSYFDIFKLYSNQRVKISDGSYSYVFYLEIPEYPLTEFEEEYSVVWKDEDVTLRSKSGFSLTVTKEAIIEQL